MELETILEDAVNLVKMIKLSINSVSENSIHKWDIPNDDMLYYMWQNDDGYNSQRTKS